MPIWVARKVAPRCNYLTPVAKGCIVLLPMTTETARKQAALAFARRLNDLLVEKNVKRRELARRLSAANGSSFETCRVNVHRLLRGDHLPNQSTRLEIAQALNINPAELKEEALSGDPFRGPDGAASPRRRGNGRGPARKSGGVAG